MNTQSAMLKACCEAQDWDYTEVLEEFNYFYVANRGEFQSLKDAVATWYRLRREKKTF